MSVKSGEAVFRPGVGGVGIAAQFPETEDVAVQEGDFADEFGAFPGVTLGQDDAGGPTVLLGEGLAVPLVGDEDVVVHAGVEGIIGGVAVVRLEKEVGGGGPGFDEFGEGEK